MATTWKNVPLAEATAGTNADMTIASGTQINRVVAPDEWLPTLSPPQFDGEQPGIFSVQLNVPSAGTAEGCIFECGGNIRGAYLGFDGNGDLIWRFDNAVGRRVVVDSSLVPKDQTITIIAELLHVGGNYVSSNPSLFPNRPLDQAKIWVNQTVRGVASNQNPNNGRWAQAVGGKVNGFWNGVVGNSGITETGNHDQDVTTSGVTFVSGLRYYHNAVVEQPAKDFQTVNVLQEMDFDRRVSWLPETDTRVVQVHSRNLRIDYENSTFHTQVVWDHNRIADVKYEDHEDHQVTQTNSRTLQVAWTDTQTARD